MPGSGTVFNANAADKSLRHARESARVRPAKPAFLTPSGIKPVSALNSESAPLLGW